MGGVNKMNIKNIILFSFLFMVLAGLTLSSVSAVKVPTKYKTHTLINKYYESDSYYSDGVYNWEPKKWNFDFARIYEKYSGSQTKLEYTIYNNNNNPYHWTDTRSSVLTVKYKIKTKTKTYYKSKTVKYNKIGKTGSAKSLTLKGPAGSQVLIYYMKWTQVQRWWYR